ncbi:MAG: hypothetical protein L6R38_000331 [Xanthoria sp. 2 TBL-2021]|nr:MAG: hypothetical protein L6R38_000331 [Xanthoria sp. 2 TBL-2021]
MPTLSYGLNITKKGPSSAAKPAPARRKTIFDDESGPEDGPDDADDNEESITSIGDGPQSSSSHQQGPTKSKTNATIPRSSKTRRISQFGDLSTNHTTLKHAQTAQSLDPSIYDYDAVYDSLHAKPVASGNASSTAAASEAKKPKYMESLLAAAEIRKRDQLRAKEKMLAKERELEGDEFADKEKFVTAAYKRQQEEVRKAEAEEALREREAAERQRREGGGLKSMYKTILERDEEKHAAALKSAEEAKMNGTLGKGQDGGKDRGRKEKSEAEIAKEKGAVVNEEGQVVDKRQLLSAGLNAGAATKARAAALTRDVKDGNIGKRMSSGDRASQTAAFEDQLLGKRGAELRGEHDDDGRASKTKRMEDEILASLGL